METVAFRRLQVDLPGETAEKLKQLAAELGVPQRRLLATMIEEKCAEHFSKKSKPKKGASKRGKG